MQDHIRGDQEGQEAPLRDLLHQGREADRCGGDRIAGRGVRPVPHQPAGRRGRRVPLRPLRFRVHAPVPGHVRVLQETEALPHVVVSRHRQG